LSQQIIMVMGVRSIRAKAPLPGLVARSTPTSRRQRPRMYVAYGIIERKPAVRRRHTGEVRIGLFSLVIDRRERCR
jgi:hypothetical protein